MIRNHTNGEPNERAAVLPETGEVRLIEALGWVAYGAIDVLAEPLGRDGPEKIEELDRLHKAWRQENREMAAGWWPSDNKDFALKLFKLRRQLGPRGKANLLVHLRYAKLDRAVEQRLATAEAELLKFARRGLVRMRGCSSELDEEAADIDPSYFDNRVAIDLFEGGLSFDYRAPLDEWLGRPHPDPLSRYRVRVSVADLRTNFPRQEVEKNPTPPNPEQAFLEWAREVLTERGSAPTVQQCNDWYQQFEGLSREWMRASRDTWPDELKRRVGQRR